MPMDTLLVSKLKSTPWAGWRQENQFSIQHSDWGKKIHTVCYLQRDCMKNLTHCQCQLYHCLVSRSHPLVQWSILSTHRLSQASPYSRVQRHHSGSYGPITSYHTCPSDNSRQLLKSESPSRWYHLNAKVKVWETNICPVLQMHTLNSRVKGYPVGPQGIKNVWMSS